MKRLSIPVLAVTLLSSVAAAFYTVRIIKSPESIGWNEDKSRFTLPNQWRVTPVGNRVELPGDMPAKIAFIPGTHLAAINTCGFHDHSLTVFDLDSHKAVASEVRPSLWTGLVAADNLLYVSSGGTTQPEKPSIRRFLFSSGKLAEIDPYILRDVTPKSRYVSGMVRGKFGLYVLNVQSNQIFLLDNEGNVKRSAATDYRPYAAALSPDGSTIAVSEWGSQSVALLDSADLHLLSRIATRPHPTDLVYHPDGRLFIAEAGSNSVLVVKPGNDVERITVSFDKIQPVGPTPVALALAPDGGRLYVALAGENAVAVLDANQSRTKLIGHIPTERYPTAIAVTPDGSSLMIATAKGFYGPNAPLPGSEVDSEGGRPHRYIGQQLTGALTMLPIPDATTLEKYSAQVAANFPDGRLSRSDEKPDPNLKKIKHVIYVIRENRTYDQVLGDVAKGNGDPSLTIFGEKVTPNGHKIANTFTLFDNLFTDGEVSQSGHQWTDSAYANDYTEKQWILSYSGRKEVESDKRLTASTGEYIWSQARKHGLWARVYGEYVGIQEDHGSLDSAEVKADPEKYGYSATWEKIFARGGRDTEKVSDFLRELKGFTENSRMPSLMVMALPDDHTHGFSVGAYTPQAMVGCNDLALGRLVEAVSKSPFWKDTAIFVIEDDAQAGPDHVDSHRTVGYVISPYTRHAAIDSSHYSTSSMLRTMETILGLPPMTSYDAHARLMSAAFAGKPNFAPYKVEAPRIDINEKTLAKTALAKRSSKLDFSDVDRADPMELNRILWEGYKPGIPYPALSH